MRATREDSLAAVAPVLADLERTHPGLLRLDLVDAVNEGDQGQAVLWQRDGSGALLSLGDGHRVPAEAVAELAGAVAQEAVDAPRAPRRAPVARADP